MPDFGELLLLTLAIAVAAVPIAWPLLRQRTHGSHVAADVPQAALADAQLQHRMALEALRDVEADRRAGSLDDEAYARDHREAEEDAARSLAGVEAALRTASAPGPAGRPDAATATSHAGRRAAVALGLLLIGALLVGAALPPPVGIGERTVVDQALADALAAEQARQAEIGRLRTLLADDPQDVATLSALADAFLAGDAPEDLQSGALALLAVIALDPDDASAYRRLITAYIRAEDWTDAAAATDAYAELVGEDDVDLAFFRGLVAWRGEQDAEAALAAFDTFLALAPDDPRASMVRSLRAEASGALP